MTYIRHKKWTSQLLKYLWWLFEVGKQADFSVEALEYLVGHFFLHESPKICKIHPIAFFSARWLFSNEKMNFRNNFSIKIFVKFVSDHRRRGAFTGHGYFWGIFDLPTQPNQMHLDLPKNLTSYVNALECSHMN